MKIQQTVPVCRLCHAAGLCTPAVAIFTLEKGCTCYPDDREQALCWRHAEHSEPLGPMMLKEDMTGGPFTLFWHCEGV